ncbi:MAG: hypothetical protein AAGG48_00270 [Planctomycetota bacterium]
MIAFPIDVLDVRKCFERRAACWTVCLFVLFMGGRPTHAQEFELLNASSGRIGVVELSGDGLFVQQSVSSSIRYKRAVAYDSLDGRLIGFFHRPTARALRFPVTGRGRLFLADLNHPRPRFRATARLVRPIIGPPHALIVNPYGGIWPMTPWIYGYDLAPVIDPFFVGRFQRFPVSRTYLVDSQTIVGDTLPPVEVKLFNDGPREVQVQVNDLLEPGKRRSVRIKPQSTVAVTLERDPGGLQVRRYQVDTGFGNWITREASYPIPSPIRYEMVVHEWAMQSIAIDRTGKSPNPIEDVQYQGRGLGRFLLPPGDELQAGKISVVETARRQGNQGTVAPILPTERSTSQDLSPLERALRDVPR